MVFYKRTGFALHLLRVSVTGRGRLHGGAVGGGTPRLGLPVIPSLREAAWSCCGGSRRDQSTARPRLMGVMTFVERAPGLVRAASRGGLSVEAADVSVTQAVVDEGEQIAGGGDLADALAAAIGDPLAVDAQLGIHGQLLDCVDAAQRTSREPCLVMWPRCTVVSDSRCLGVSPAQEHSWDGPGKRRTSPISAVKIASEVGPTPGSAWMAR